MPYAEAAILAVFAAVIGLLVFGGTTLAALAEGCPRKRDIRPRLRLRPSPSTARRAEDQDARSETAA